MNFRSLSIFKRLRKTSNFFVEWIRRIWNEIELKRMFLFNLKTSFRNFFVFLNFWHQIFQSSKLTVKIIKKICLTSQIIILFLSPITAIQLNWILHCFVFVISYLVIFYFTTHSFLIFDIFSQNNFIVMKYFSQIIQFIYIISIHSMWSNIKR